MTFQPPSSTPSSLPPSPSAPQTPVVYSLSSSTAQSSPTQPPSSTITTPPLPPSPPTPQTRSSPPPSPSQMMCADGWDVFQGRCYNFVNEPFTWSQAQSNCAMSDSMLASVHSPQEYGFLQQLTNNNGNQEAWLGGFYLQDQWLWIDGSWFYNNSWSSESPDSSNPCLVLSSSAQWSNSPCDPGGFASICMKNSNVPADMLCPDGWTGFLGRCYYFNSDYLSWAEANTVCADLHASLVSVHSPQEYFFLYQQTASDGHFPTWLGGFYLQDQWMWLDGSWFYLGFFTQESEDNTDQCLSMNGPDGWVNMNCDQTQPSFCVKDVVM